MNNPEDENANEISIKHNCTFVLFCDDTARDVWEDTGGYLITFSGQTINRVAKKYAHNERHFLFEQHRKHCTGKNPRKHSVTIRFEVDNFSEIHYVSLGVDTWK